MPPTFLITMQDSGGMIFKKLGRNFYHELTKVITDWSITEVVITSMVPRSPTDLFFKIGIDWADATNPDPETHYDLRMWDGYIVPNGTEPDPSMWPDFEGNAPVYLGVTPLITDILAAFENWKPQR